MLKYPKCLLEVMGLRERVRRIIGFILIIIGLTIIASIIYKKIETAKSKKSSKIY